MHQLIRDIARVSKYFLAVIAIALYSISTYAKDNEYGVHDCDDRIMADEEKINPAKNIGNNCSASYYLGMMVAEYSFDKRATVNFEGFGIGFDEYDHEDTDSKLLREAQSYIANNESEAFVLDDAEDISDSSVDTNVKKNGDKNIDCKTEIEQLKLVSSFADNFTEKSVVNCLASYYLGMMVADQLFEKQAVLNIKAFENGFNNYDHDIPDRKLLKKAHDFIANNGSNAFSPADEDSGEESSDKVKKTIFDFQNFVEVDGFEGLKPSADSEIDSSKLILGYLKPESEDERCKILGKIRNDTKLDIRCIRGSPTGALVANNPELSDKSIVKVSFRRVIPVENPNKSDERKFLPPTSKWETVVYPLNGVIAGWRQSLKNMNPDDIFRLVISPDLAYKDTKVGDIEPNSILLYELALHEIID